VPDDIDVKCTVLSGWTQLLHDYMSLICCDLWTDQPQPACDAMNMRVHREDGLVVTKEQHNGRCLGTNAIDARQPLAAFIHRKLSQEVDIKLTAFFRDTA
jgi:hypothetical protein